MHLSSANSWQIIVHILRVSLKFQNLVFFCHLRHSSTDFPPYFQMSRSKSGPVRQMSKKRDSKVTMLVVWMNLAFLTCWMPYGIIVILSIYGGEGYVEPMYIVIPLLASKSSVCWNPFLYVCLNFQVIIYFFIVNFIESS